MLCEISLCCAVQVMNARSEMFRLMQKYLPGNFLNEESTFLGVIASWLDWSACPSLPLSPSLSLLFELISASSLSCWLAGWRMQGGVKVREQSDHAAVGSVRGALRRPSDHHRHLARHATWSACLSSLLFLLMPFVCVCVW